MTQGIDARALVTWLGAQGAKAGLKESRKCTVEVLAQVARRLGIEVGDKPTRRELIEEIVKVAGQRIDKPLHDLFAMDHDQLVQYLESVGAEREELLDLVKRLDLDPGREGLRNLVHFVAREIS